MVINGRYFDNRVFVANQADLLFREEEFIERIKLGLIGPDTKILGGSIGPDVVLGTKCIVMGHLTGLIRAGDNCVFGWESRIKGGVFGDNVVIGDYVIIGSQCRVGSLVQIGNATTLAGRTHIGDYVIIGASCALENTTVDSETVLGNHTLTEESPHIPSGSVVPNGATIVGAHGKQSMIEIIAF